MSQGPAKRTRGLLGSFLAIVVLAALAAPSASAAPAVTGEFPVSEIDGNDKLTAGPDGNVWVTLSAAIENVARITPDGEVKEFDVPDFSNPSGITSDGTHLWITGAGKQLAKFLPGNPESLATTVEYVIPEIEAFTSIVYGPDGNLWVATTGHLLRISPSIEAGKEADFYTAFPIPELSPRDIDVAGSNLVISDFGKARIVYANTSGDYTEIPLAGGSQGVAGSPDGQFAFTQQGEEPHELGLVTPPGGPTLTPLPGTDPFGVARGADGAYWFALFTKDGLARLTPSGEVTTLEGFEAGSGPRQVAAGPGGTLWVTLQNTSKVGRVSGVEPPASPAPPTLPANKPETRITKAPKGKVTTRKKRATVRIRFNSPDAGAKFECALLKLKKRKKGKPAPKPKFRPCKSPRVLKLKPGRYRFLVRAVLSGEPDPSPAKRTFRVVRAR